MPKLDDMIEFTLEELLSGSSARRRTLVRQMCLRWPDMPALSLVFALTSAAALIEDSMVPETAEPQVGPLAYRLAALLSADVFAAESISKRPAKANDLLHFWRRVDPSYLAP